MLYIDSAPIPLIKSSHMTPLRGKRAEECNVWLRRCYGMLIGIFDV